MTTTTANIAQIPVPLGPPLKRQCCSGVVYDVDIFDPRLKKKKKKKKIGVYEIFIAGEEVVLEAKKDRKSVVNGKSGVWRRYRGRNHFFPDDRSGPIPPIGSKFGGPIA